MTLRKSLESFPVTVITRKRLFFFSDHMLITNTHRREASSVSLAGLYFVIATELWQYRERLPNDEVQGNPCFCVMTLRSIQHFEPLPEP